MSKAVADYNKKHGARVVVKISGGVEFWPEDILAALPQEALKELPESVWAAVSADTARKFRPGNGSGLVSFCTFTLD